MLGLKLNHISKRGLGLCLLLLFGGNWPCFNGTELYKDPWGRRCLPLERHHVIVNMSNFTEHSTICLKVWLGLQQINHHVCVHYTIEGLYVRTGWFPTRRDGVLQKRTSNEEDVAMRWHVVALWDAIFSLQRIISSPVSCYTLQLWYSSYIAGKQNELRSTITYHS